MKVFSITKGLFLLTLLAGITFFNKDTFALSDISDSDFKSYIENAYDAKIIGGYSDNTFRPEKNVSFVESLKIAINAGNNGKKVKNISTDWKENYRLWYTQNDSQTEKKYHNDETISRDFAIYIIVRQLGISAEDYRSEGANFSDIREDSLFAPYIQLVKDAGVVSGYSDSTFGPEQAVNRGEFAKMTWKILKEDSETILATYHAHKMAKIDTSTPVYQLSQAEIRAGLLQAINAYRQENGVAPLRSSSILDTIAIEYAEDMSKRRYFSHTSPDGETLVERAQSKNYQAKVLAENLGKGQNTIDQVMREWKASPTHNANLLLADVDVVGFGYINGYWVQEFAMPRSTNDTMTGKFVARK